MAILSIQSWVAYGHVGNAAAIFPLQRLGMEIWAVNTVQFSNHPGHGAWTGQAATGQQVRDLVDGVAALGVLDRCRAVLGGYLGRAEIGDAVLHAVARARSANPAALYCCDPVIGDAGPGVYVAAGIPEFLRARCVPAADILTPNQFELERLAGARVATLADAKRAVTQLLAAMRPGGVVLATSLRTEDTPADAVDLLTGGAQGFHRLRTPLLPIAANGAGDVIAGLFLFHRLAGAQPAEAMALAASSVFGLLRRTQAAGSRELLIVAAQEEFVAPSRIFDAIAC